MIGFNTASVCALPILAAALSKYNLPPLKFFESQGEERFDISRVHYHTRKTAVSSAVHYRCLDLTSMKVCLDTGKMLTIPESPCLGGLFHLSGPKARAKDHHEQVRRHLYSFKPRFALLEHGLEDAEAFAVEYEKIGYAIIPLALSSYSYILQVNSNTWSLILPTDHSKAAVSQISELATKIVQKVNNAITQADWFLLSKDQRKRIADPADRPESVIQDLPEDIYRVTAPYLKSIEGGIGFGGLSAFGLDEYRSSLAHVKQYECTLTGDMFKEYCFCHAFPPSCGQLERAEKQFEESVSETDDSILIWPYSVSLRALDGVTPPQKATLQVLGNDVLWLGFLKFFASCIQKTDAKRITMCREALRRVKVKFHLCQTDEEAHRMKWTLDQGASDLAKSQTLRGWKRICGYAAIREELKSRGQAGNGEAISAWLKKAKVSMAPKTLNTLLRVYDRMRSAGQDTLAVLEDMDSLFDEHFFSNTSTLTAVCEKTAVSKNKLLEDALLTWVVAGLHVRVTSSNNGTLKVLAPTASRDIVLQHTSVELALRRVVQYISNKMARAAHVRDGGNDSVRLCDAFGTYKNFIEFRDNQEARKLFLSRCSPAEVQAATFIKTAMEGNIVIHDILSTAIATNWLQPAELIMQSQVWVEKEIINLEVLLDPLEPMQTQLNQTETAAALATKPEAAAEAESVPDTPLKDEIPEVTTDGAGPVEQPRSRASFFSAAIIPAWAEDLFQKVTLATFEQSLEHARACRVLILQFRTCQKFSAAGIVWHLLGHLI
ncbi:unnamed protein product [Symbiodinium sp. CCMP2592]|nr:unnamed protein product [Symbiodinium sp. CCMP2592]